MKIENQNSHVDKLEASAGERRSNVGRRFPSFEFQFSNFNFPISIFLSRYRRLLILLVAAVIWLTLPAPLSGQGCAMCYTSAAAAKEAGLQALRNGILILGIPPLVMFIGIFWYALRRRDRFNDTGFEDDRGRDELPSELTPGLPGDLGEKPESALSIVAWPGDCNHSENSISSRQGH